MILIRIECLMIFQNLFAYCQPVQLRNNLSRIVIESPEFSQTKFSELTQQQKQRQV